MRIANPPKPRGVIRKMIEEAAYYRAARRGFEPGHELEDWLAAESEVLGATLKTPGAHASPAGGEQRVKGTARPDQAL